MDPVTLAAALQIGVQLTQAAMDWQTKMAAGGITPADIDAKLLEIGLSRADLVTAIAEATPKAP